MSIYKKLVTQLKYGTTKGYRVLQQEICKRLLPLKFTFFSERAKNFYKKGMQFDPDNQKIKTAFKKVRNIERVR